MTLRLKRAADQLPGANWEPDNEHLVVLSGEIIVGGIKKTIGGPSDGAWQWSITCLHLPPNRGVLSGAAATREEAQEQLAGAWRQWLARAGLKEER